MQEEEAEEEVGQKSNLERLGEAVAPFLGTDVVELFRTPEGVERMKAALEPIASPELEVRMVGVEGGLVGRFSGVEGFIEAWRDFVEVFEDFENEVEDFVEGDDSILVLTRQVGRTATSGVPMENAGAGVFRFEGETLVRAEFHLDRDSALRAAGLDPQSRQL